MAVFGQTVRAQGLHDGIAVFGANLQDDAQLFAEQRFEREFLAARAHLARPVFAIAHVHAAVGHAVALQHQHVHIERHAHPSCECHLRHGGEQAAVTAVVVGQNFSLTAKGVNSVHQRHQVLRVVQVRRLVTHLLQGLRQDAGRHAVFATPQVHQNQRAVQVRVQLRRQGAPHVAQGGKGGDDERHGRSDFFAALRIAPLGAHGQGVFTHRDRYTQRRAQFQAHGFDGGIERSVFARLPASCHPVGGEFDAGQLNRRGQQIGNRLGHRHAARGRSVHGCERRALSHGHGLTAKAHIVGQRDGAIGHRHLPGSDHLVTVGQAAHRAVTDGDQKAFGCHGGMRQHVDHRLLQTHTGEVQRSKAALHGGHIAVHFGRLAQEHVHGHVHRRSRVGRHGVGHHQLTLFGGHAHDCKRAAFALAQGGEQRQRFGRDGQHVTLLAFVAPDFFGRHATFFERYGTQVKAGAASCVIGELGKRIGQAARTHVVDRQNRVAGPTWSLVLTQHPALVDHLLGTAFHFGVTALNRVKVQVRSVRARGHGAGGTAPHTDPHTRAAELN